ncbi:unnamed protein product, partial [Pocillopora meandrina]
SYLFSAFKSPIHLSSSLSKKAKQILFKPSCQRREEEIKVIFGIVDKLKCFSRYTPLIKREIAKVVYFQQFEDGRVIVKQGQPGRSMYFILRGTVFVQVAETDKIAGLRMKQIVGEMFAGDSFGELALLHDITRAATVICKGTVEFLTIDKPDFDMAYTCPYNFYILSLIIIELYQVLKRSYQQEWETKMSLLTSSPCFKDRSPKELQQANSAAKLVEYPANTVILRDAGNPGECIYFIRSGQCQVVREMTLVRRTPPLAKRRLILPPLEAEGDNSHIFKIKSYDYVRKHFLVVCLFGKGDYFGVGEDFTKMSIISVNKVEIVLVQKRHVMAKHEKGRILEEMKDKLNKQLPSRREVFRSFVAGEKWRHYKLGIRNELRTKKWLLNPTKLQDVPYSIQEQHLY